MKPDHSDNSAINEDTGQTVNNDDISKCHPTTTNEVLLCTAPIMVE